MVHGKTTISPLKEVRMNVLFPLIRNRRQVRLPEWDLLDRLFSDSLASRNTETKPSWRPAVDVTETPQEIVVQAEVPGMEKEDLDLTLSEGLLTIRGEKRAETKAENARSLRGERRYGSFSRTLRIPATVVVGEIDASYKNGLLTVRLPKRVAAESRRVPVQNPRSEEAGQPS